MAIDETCRKDVVNRLRRIQGQVAGIVTMIDEGRDCSDVMVQVAAVSRAIDRAGFKIISAELQACAAASQSGEEPSMSMEKIEKLFLTLA
jgi:DNA-binding FrmR family transcriptional regulator